MKSLVKLHDLSFGPFLSEQAIQSRVQELGRLIKEKHEHTKPLFLGVLNGSFIFAADLIRTCDFDCEISFIKLSSYRGTKSSGSVATVIGLEEDIKGRKVIIVEDIIDSGRTMHKLVPELKKLGAESVEIAALLVKPDAMEFKVPIDYLGFSIPIKFVVGYGLDYDGLGRNLKEIYQLVE